MRTTRTEEEFRQQLAELIEAQGISALTVGEIAAQLQCSRRRLYAIAETKEGLLLCVAQWIFDRIREKGNEAAKRESDLSRAIAAYTEAGAVESANIGIPFLRDLQATEEGSRLYEDFQQERTNGLKSLVEQGGKSGVFARHDPQLVASAFLGAFREIRKPQFMAQTTLTYEEAFRELVALMLEGLLARPREATESRAAKAEGTGRRPAARKA